MILETKNGQYFQANCFCNMCKVRRAIYVREMKEMMKGIKNANIPDNREYISLKSDNIEDVADMGFYHLVHSLIANSREVGKVGVVDIKYRRNEVNIKNEMKKRFAENVQEVKETTMQKTINDVYKRTNKNQAREINRLRKELAEKTRKLLRIRGITNQEE